MLWVLFSINLFLSAVLAVLGIRYRQLRRQMLQSQIQRLVYLHSLDLHNLFNALNKLAALIMTTERQQAYLFLISFSKILKNRLTFEPPLTWSFQDELAFIRAYHEAIALNGNKVPTLFLPDGVDNLKIAIPVLAIYSLYRNLSFEKDIESATLQILLKSEKGILQIVLKIIDVEKSEHFKEHARSSELLQLYQKYFGSRFRFSYREGGSVAELNWKK